VSWKRFGPDHTEMMLAIRTHKRLVAWHLENSGIVD
jgi:hypothetical protein